MMLAPESSASDTMKNSIRRPSPNPSGWDYDKPSNKNLHNFLAPEVSRHVQKQRDSKPTTPSFFIPGITGRARCLEDVPRDKDGSVHVENALSRGSQARPRSSRRRSQLAGSSSPERSSLGRRSTRSTDDFRSSHSKHEDPPAEIASFNNQLDIDAINAANDTSHTYSEAIAPRSKPPRRSSKSMDVCTLRNSSPSSPNAPRSTHGPRIGQLSSRSTDNVLSSHSEHQGQQTKSKSFNNLMDVIGHSSTTSLSSLPVRMETLNEEWMESPHPTTTSLSKKQLRNIRSILDEIPPAKPKSRRRSSRSKEDERNSSKLASSVPSAPRSTLERKSSRSNDDVRSSRNKQRAQLDVCISSNSAPSSPLTAAVSQLERHSTRSTDDVGSSRSKQKAQPAKAKSLNNLLDVIDNSSTKSINSLSSLPLRMVTMKEEWTPSPHMMTSSHLKSQVSSIRSILDETRYVSYM